MTIAPKQNVSHKVIFTDINCDFTYSQCQDKRLFHTINKVFKVVNFIGLTEIATALDLLLIGVWVTADRFLPYPCSR